MSAIKGLITQYPILNEIILTGLIAYIRDYTFLETLRFEHSDSDYCKVFETSGFQKWKSKNYELF